MGSRDSLLAPRFHFQGPGSRFFNVRAIIETQQAVAIRPTAQMKPFSVPQTPTTRKPARRLTASRAPSSVPSPAKEQRLEVLRETIIACRKCPRLVEYRERVARTKRRAYLDWTYWGRPVP